MFHRLASSGSSSSESWYSSSKSLTDLRFGCQVCFWMGTRADSGERPRLVLEAERLDVGRSGETDRDRRACDGVKPGECNVLPGSFRAAVLAVREPADTLVEPLWSGGRGLRLRGLGTAVKSRVEAAGTLLDILAAGDRAITPERA